MPVENGKRFYERRVAPDGSFYYDVGDIIEVEGKKKYKISSELAVSTEEEARKLIGL